MNKYSVPYVTLVRSQF